MEIPSPKWLSAELEVKDSAFLHQYEMDNLYNSTDGLNFQPYSSESHSYYPNFTSENEHNLVNFPFEIPQTGTESPATPLKSNSWSSCTTEYTSTKASSSSSPHLISFQNSSSPPEATMAEQYRGLDCTIIKPENEEEYHENMILIPPFISHHQDSSETLNYYGLQKFGHGLKRPFGAMMSRSPLHAQHHVIAERKRREMLTQRFIALSAVLPGLKKMDKASVLGDAIRFVKQLRERVKILEEKAAKSVGESRIIVKRTKVVVDDDHDIISSSSDENCCSLFADKSLPEVEAKVSNKDILIRIYCEKYKGCLVNILREIEKLHLTVLDSSVLQFGNSTLDITIVAQMDVEFCMEMRDLVRYLRQALLNFI